MKNYACGYRDNVLGRDGYQVALWYPSEGTEAPVKYRGYPGSAAKGSDIAAGSHPLILVSHGTLGHRFCHCWLAEILARAGFMVAALQHPGDNVTDDAIARTPAGLAARPAHVSETLDGLLASDDLVPFIDQKRVGLLGHSVGGCTCLMLLGAEPDMGKLWGYCRSDAGDLRTCERMPLDTEPPVMPDAYDDRFSCAMIMMAAYGPAFGEEEMSFVDGAVHVISAPNDEVIPDARNGQHMAAMLGERAELTLIDGAGHYSSMPLPTELLRRDYPALCADGGGAREDVHTVIQQKALAFFTSELGQA